MIRVINYILREGCQACQCSLDNARSTQLARKIVVLRVDMIRCGHSRISADERKWVRAMVAAVSTPVLARAWARREDVDTALKAGTQRVGLFVSTNAVSLETKFKGMNREEVFELFHDAIRYACERSLRARVTVKDVTRTSISDLVSMIVTARDTGADRICFTDDVGTLLPDGIFDMLFLLRHEPPDVIFECHVHNNCGPALGNTLMTAQAGVQRYSASCNGTGRHVGIVDIPQLLTLLHTKLATDRLSLKDVLAVSELVEAHGRAKCLPMYPTVGENTFTHVACSYQLAMQKNRNVYSAFNSELINGRVLLQRYTPMHRQSLLLIPLEKPVSELKYHRHGPGKRFVVLDWHLLDGSPLYFTARQSHDADDGGPGHVDSHVYNCDLVFLFPGSDEGYYGLEVKVLLGGQLCRSQSPASVLIPADVKYNYHYLSGSSTYINFIHKGGYRRSLLEIT